MTKKFENGMRKLIASKFDEYEQGLAKYLADYFIKCATEENTENQNAVDYFYDNGDRIMDESSDNLFKFLSCYALNGLYDAIDSELTRDTKEGSREAYKAIIVECLKYEDLDTDIWNGIFEEWLEDTF